MAADLGDMIARLLLDSKDFDSAMATAGANAEAQAEKIQNSFGGIGQGLARVAASLAAIGLADKISDFAEECLKASSEMGKFRSAMETLVGPGKEVAQFISDIDE